MMWGYGWDHGFWGIFGMTIFWGAIVTLVVLALRGVTSDKGEEFGPKDPKDLLAERFARGEIEEEEFRARSRALEELTTEPRVPPGASV